MLFIASAWHAHVSMVQIGDVRESQAIWIDQVSDGKFHLCSVHRSRCVCVYCVYVFLYNVFSFDHSNRSFPVSPSPFKRH